MLALRETLELFLLQAGMVFRRMMAYRLNFVLSILFALGFSLVGPLFQFLLYQNSRGYPGWSWDQILVFQAVLILVGGISDTLFGNLRPQIDAMVGAGEFDRLMIKPRKPLLLILCSGFNPSALGSLLVGLALTAWATVHLGVPAGWLGLGLFVIMILARVLFQAAVQILYCFFVVRWVYPMRLSETMDKILAWGNTPLEIFPQAVQMVFCTVLPFSIAAYWPAKSLVGPVGLLALASLAGVLLFLGTVLSLWGHQLKKYASGGG